MKILRQLADTPPRSPPGGSPGAPPPGGSPPGSAVSSRIVGFATAAEMDNKYKELKQNSPFGHFGIDDAAILFENVDAAGNFKNNDVNKKKTLCCIC